MAPFQYQPYENRLAGSIGDILARRGEIAAAAAQRAGIILSNSTRAQGDITARGVEQAGAATARGQEQGAAAMGSAIGGAVQRIGAIPEQAAQLQAQDVQRQNAQLEVDQKKRAAADLSALDQAYSQPGGRDAILKSLQDSGKGHLIPGVSKTFEEFDKAHADAQKLQGEADAAKISAFARAGMMVRAHGYDPQSAMIMISDLKQKYANDPASLAMVKQHEAALLANPSAETVKAIVDPILQADPKTREDLATEAAHKETTRQHDLEDAGRKATAAETLARDAQTKKDEDARRELEGRRVAAEEANARTSGSREKREQAIFDQTYGAGGTNPDGSPKQAPISGTAKAIAEYRMAPLTGRAATTGAGKAIMDQVTAANPSYDGTQYPARAAMRKAYTSGNQSQQLGALNTAIEHLGVLDEMAKALDNGSFKPGNELYNKVKTMFGDSAPTNFEFARDIMSGELATAMKKSGATDTEIEKVTKSLSGSGSPKQLSDAIRVVALPMIGGKASTMQQQYRAVMGDKDPFSVYTPGAQGVLDRFNAGHAAAAPVGGGKGGGPGVVAPAAARDGYVRVVGPNGETGQAPKGSALPAGWKVVQ